MRNIWSPGDPADALGVDRILEIALCCVSLLNMAIIVNRLNVAITGDLQVHRQMFSRTLVCKFLFDTCNTLHN